MPDESVSRLAELAERLTQQGSAAGDTDAGDRPVLVLGSPPPGIADELLHAPSSRRAFLARASTLSLAIPGFGAALAACSSSEGNDGGTARGSASVAGRAASPGAAAGTTVHNSDSRLDSTLLDTAHHGTSSATETATQRAQGATFHRYAPELPPLPVGGIQRLHWHSREAPIRIDETTVVAAWTFESDVPGPVVHTRVGDTVEFTLTNDADIPHSMDFHAAQINPKEAFRSVPRGQSVTFAFKPKWAGAFMYHCGTAPVLMHIASGMYGAIIVQPREGMPAAREFVLVQSEWYLAQAANGVRASD